MGVPAADEWGGGQELSEESEEDEEQAPAPAVRPSLSLPPSLLARVAYRRRNIMPAQLSEQGARPAPAEAKEVEPAEPHLLGAWPAEDGPLPPRYASMRMPSRDNSSAGSNYHGRTMLRSSLTGDLMDDTARTGRLSVAQSLRSMEPKRPSLASSNYLGGRTSPGGLAANAHLSVVTAASRNTEVLTCIGSWAGGKLYYAQLLNASNATWHGPIATDDQHIPHWQ